MTTSRERHNNADTHTSVLKLTNLRGVARGCTDITLPKQQAEGLRLDGRLMTQPTSLVLLLSLTIIFLSRSVSHFLMRNFSNVKDADRGARMSEPRGIFSIKRIKKVGEYLARTDYL